MPSQNHRNWFMRKTPEHNGLLCLLWANTAINAFGFVLWVVS